MTISSPANNSRPLCFLLAALVPLLARGDPQALPAAPPVPAEVPSSAVLHSVLMAGNPAGTQATWRSDDGKTHVFFEFNDRGRGPRVTTEITAGPDNIPSALQNTGVDYYKGPVVERFSAVSGKASWKNKAEQGEKPAGKAFYSSMYGPPEEGAMLARALLASGDRLPLLPDGEARIERVGERRLEAGGQSVAVSQYAITGLDFSPTTIWLDGDQSLFASGGSWFMVIRKGWESARPAILDAQRQSENSRAADLARRLAHRPSGDVVIYGASLFDPETAAAPALTGAAGHAHGRAGRARGHGRTLPALLRDPGGARGSDAPRRHCRGSRHGRAGGLLPAP